MGLDGPVGLRIFVDPDGTDGHQLQQFLAFLRRGRGESQFRVRIVLIPALDFTGLRGEERRRYFRAVQDGLDRNYAPMALIFRRVIERTLRQQSTV